MKDYNQFISVAKREKNPKREFLLLNRLQGKHVPSKPSETMEMFQDLSETIINNLEDFEEYVSIGFAETATAIGMYIGQALKIPTMQTTRETIENVEYLFFSEEHSHAKEQKIIKNDLDLLLENNIKGILFIEDELTTGNTILNGIKIIKATYPEYNIKFAVASIINCMENEHLEKFKESNVNCFYCSKYEAKNYISSIKDLVPKEDEKIIYINKEETHNYYVEKFKEGINIRRSNLYEDIHEVTEEFLEQNLDEIHIFQEDVLVLGTEEFMYMGLMFGYVLEKMGNKVHFHATTRSPMLPSDNKNYVIEKRYKLRSVYENERTTFIYNLRKYDKIFIVTDSEIENNNGIEDLIKALESCGNNNITILEWNNEN